MDAAIVEDYMLSRPFRNVTAMCTVEEHYDSLADKPRLHYIDIRLGERISPICLSLRNSNTAWLLVHAKYPGDEHFVPIQKETLMLHPHWIYEGHNSMLIHLHGLYKSRTDPPACLRLYLFQPDIYLHPHSVEVNEVIALAPYDDLPPFYLPQLLGQQQPIIEDIRPSTQQGRLLSALCKTTGELARELSAIK